MNATNQIFEALNTLFADQDKLIADSDVKWALKVAQELREFLEAEKAKPRSERLNAWGFDAHVVRICGSRSSYQMLCNNDEGVEYLFRENAKQVAKARNARIAKKLQASGVNDVVDSKIEISNDGFNGYFTVVTDIGKKIINISSILAGGYNIQRLHQRVLCKIK
jgi:hypothetical protein